MSTEYQNYWIAISRYCAYRERSQNEVRFKLVALGARGEMLEELMSQLVVEGFLNEERYATAFARGHFNLKSWGRAKIRAHLINQKISTYCLQKAMAEIDEDDYVHKLEGLLQKKARELNATRPTATNKGKLYRYLTQKGYEPLLVREQIVKYYSKG